MARVENLLMVHTNEASFVAWELWENCYIINHMPWNIKKPVFFQSLADCEKYVNKYFITK